ncbi:glyoxalase/bleomycin resistance/extradiol dioxygenase family protein [bacterium]|nr:MAG: glyoxalase/bleomycin resistance/extradiol dioxygenase family protein [bacterium]
MATQIFLNFSVKDLKRSVEFFTKLGYSFDPKFTDENATCLILGENIFAMLLVEPFFLTFIKKPICEAHRCTEAIVSLTVEDREKVDEIVKKAVAAGAKPGEPQDYGFMYSRGFEDLDGHMWDFVYMDMEAFLKQQKQAAK